MQFLAALVEHIIVGVFSLLWILPFADHFSLIPSIDMTNFKEILIAVGAPIAYVVGMYVDIVASVFSSLTKRAVDSLAPGWRKSFFGASLSNKGGQSYERTAIIMKNSPDEAAKYLLQLSSREKIARGVFLSFFLAALVNFLIPQGNYKLPVTFLLIIGIIGIIVWLRLNALTDNFKSYWTNP